MVELPRHILERVERVYACHRSTKLFFTGKDPRAEAGTKPSAYRSFSDHPKVTLPTTLLDVPMGALAVLELSLGALPDSFVSPPQTLKTLASWLYLANGVLTRDPGAAKAMRTCPSFGDVFPFEIYVAAFALQDVEPGLYHYNPREFSLRKLREGQETLAQIKRGRPDLEFIKRAPAALLVSTLYCRASWKFGARGYRTALLDAGQLVQNLVTTAGGLGIQTITRLRMNENTMRELIGVPPDAEFGDEESVQSMVVWADRTQREVILTQVPALAARHAMHASARDSFRTPERLAVAINTGGAAVASLEAPDLMLPTIGRTTMAPIPRSPLAAEIKSYGSILAVHDDCVAPGVAVREIRPPLTELSPMPAGYPLASMAAVSLHDTGVPLRTPLLGGMRVADFVREPLARDAFRTINRLSFGGGSYFPLFPAGAHVALVRPFWVVHNVAGMDPGIWYYRADVDGWCLLRRGGLRLETQYLAHEDQAAGNASAVCFMVSNMYTLLTQAGPDTYRLAHLEAGTVAQRIALASRGFGFASRATATFYDDELRKFLGLEQTGWEPLVTVAVGVPIDQRSTPPETKRSRAIELEGGWHG